MLRDGTAGLGREALLSAEPLAARPDRAVASKADGEPILAGGERGHGDLDGARLACAPLRRLADIGKLSRHGRR